MRWAFKLGYLGERFHGSARQPDLRTVEGELLGALRAEGVVRDPQAARFRMASRTDRGVHALGNVVAFDTEADSRAVAAAVNRRVDDLWVHAYRQVERGFDPRRAQGRWYRYVFRSAPDPGRLRRGAQLFVGTHDFRGFARRPDHGVCNLTSLEVREEDGALCLDVHGDRFLWNMVRRICGALLRYAEGGLARGDLLRGLEGDPLAIPPAPPQFLWLMDVRYELPFTAFAPTSLRSRLRSRADVLAVEGRMLSHLADGLPRTGQPDSA